MQSSYKTADHPTTGQPTTNPPARIRPQWREELSPQKDNTITTLDIDISEEQQEAAGARTFFAVLRPAARNPHNRRSKKIAVTSLLHVARRHLRETPV